MNCRRFHEQMYEYLDGALSPRERAAAENHLAQCDACRGALREGRQFAQGLSDQLRSRTDSLRLVPEVRRRIVRAVVEAAASRRERTILRVFWQRFAWPLATAAGIVAAAVLAVNLLHRGQKSGPEAGSSPPNRVSERVIVSVIYEVPSYTFHREGAAVIDALVRQTNTVRAHLWAAQDRKTVTKE